MDGALLSPLGVSADSAELGGACSAPWTAGTFAAATLEAGGLEATPAALVWSDRARNTPHAKSASVAKLAMSQTRGRRHHLAWANAGTDCASGGWSGKTSKAAAFIGGAGGGACGSAPIGSGGIGGSSGGRSRGGSGAAASGSGGTLSAC
jgi:hypothetical protein